LLLAKRGGRSRDERRGGNTGQSRYRLTCRNHSAARGVVPITIGEPAFSTTEHGFSVDYPVSGMRRPVLNYSVSGADRDFYSARADAAVVGLLMQAMETGMDIEVETTMSPLLLASLNDQTIPFLATAFGYSPIRVHGNHTSATALRGAPAVVAGMSNGVDSLTLYARHSGATAAPEERLTHFLFNDIGSHGDTTRARASALAQSRRQRVQATAATAGLPLITVKSNLPAFYSSSFSRTHTLRNASVAMLLGGRVFRFLYASGVKKISQRTQGISDTAYADDSILPSLRTESLSCASSDSDLSRVMKTSIVAELPIAHKHLDVCLVGWPNCCRCFKCCRTIFTLELLGAAERFREVFDFDVFDRVRDRFVAHVILGRDVNPGLSEIFLLMEEAGYRISARQERLASLLRPLHRMNGSRIARSAYKRLCGFPPSH
jgi:hypothetical protein